MALAAFQTQLSIIYQVTYPFSSLSLQCRHAKPVRDSSSRYKSDYVALDQNILNPKGHQSRCTGSNA